MISAIEWVPAGVADPNPKKYEFSQAELELIEMMEKQNFDNADADGEEEETSSPTKSQGESSVQLPKMENTLPADLRMDEYSSDEDENDAVQGTTIGSILVEDVIDEEDEELMKEPEKEGLTKDPEENTNQADQGKSDEDMESDDSDDDSDLDDIPDTREYTPLDVEGFNNLGLSKVGTSAPTYMDMPNDGEDEDDDSDAEDVQIQAGDAILVAAKTEEDFASLEVHVYEQKTGNLYVHHDIPLPAFPLCLAHGDISPTGSAGNFCAVGTFTPGIEIWNLDVLHALEPNCVLGGDDTTMADDIMRHNIMSAVKKGKKKLKLGQGPSLRAGSHTDAVMALSWNKVHRQVIASGSADCAVKLWDVTQAGTNECNAATFNHHKDKVQSVLWHPLEGTLLATGSYDRTVALVDARSQENIRRVKLPGDCESLAWDPHNTQYLTAASEDGTLTCWDVRKFSDKTPVWSIVANEYGGVSDISYNPLVPGMLATCAVDKTVTLWDTYNTTEDPATGPPRACGNKDMGVGKLYTINFYPSTPWLMGCAGGAKELALWDMTREDAIQKRFGSRAKEASQIIPEDPVEPSTSEETTQQTKEAAFDAMMSAEPSPSVPAETTPVETTPANPTTNKTKKGSSNKKKKGGHKSRR